MGGRNLVRDTGAAQTFTFSAGMTAGRSVTWDPYSMVSAWSSIGVSAGDPLTLSFDWKVTGAPSGATLKVGTNATPLEFFGTVLTLAAGSSSGHVSMSTTASSALTSSTGTMFRVRFDSPSRDIAVGMAVTLSNVIVERGNKASDWTPAPEDTSTLIRQYSDGVLVCKTGNTVGALMNASGSFDVVDVTWDGSTPKTGAAIATLGADSVSLSKNALRIKAINAKNSPWGGDMTQVSIPMNKSRGAIGFVMESKNGDVSDTGFSYNWGNVGDGGSMSVVGRLSVSDGVSIGGKPVSREAFLSAGSSVADLDACGAGVFTYNTSTANRPTDYGVCVCISADNGNWLFQLALPTSGDPHWRRNINGYGWTAWWQWATS